MWDDVSSVRDSQEFLVFCLSEQLSCHIQKCSSNPTMTRVGSDQLILYLQTSGHLCMHHCTSVYKQHNPQLVRVSDKFIDVGTLHEHKVLLMMLSCQKLFNRILIQTKLPASLSASVVNARGDTQWGHRVFQPASVRLKAWLTFYMSSGSLTKECAVDRSGAVVWHRSCTLGTWGMGKLIQRMHTWCQYVGTAHGDLSWQRHVKETCKAHQSSASCHDASASILVDGSIRMTEFMNEDSCQDSSPQGSWRQCNEWS